jgi:hypothetical protein
MIYDLVCNRAIFHTQGEDCVLHLAAGELQGFYFQAVENVRFFAA